MNIFLKLNYSLSFVNTQTFKYLRSLMKSASQMKSLRDEILTDEVIASRWLIFSSRKFGWPKWTRTTDLVLIRHAL